MYQTSQGYCGGCTGGSCVGYSRLESMASTAVSYSSSGNTAYSASAPINSNNYVSPTPQPAVSAFNYNALAIAPRAYNHLEPRYQLFTPQPEYSFIPDNFLKPGKGSKFVGKAEEVREFVEETFEKMFDTSFPDDIKISVLNGDKFRKLSPNGSTIGLSINRNKQGLLSEIFILNDTLARVMLTIGHELGHVLTETLPNQHDEEAKAYAFSLAWMETIKEYNIAGLGGAIVFDSPAQNGLHNVAFDFVRRLVKQGKKIWDVYRGLVRGRVSVVG